MLGVVSGVERSGEVDDADTISMRSSSFYTSPTTFWGGETAMCIIIQKDVKLHQRSTEGKQVDSLFRKRILLLDAGISKAEFIN